MTKRIHVGLRQFAKEIGAVRSDDRPDWYLVAEHLAAKHEPALLSELSRGPGRPSRPWRWLVHDVDLVIRQRGCSVEDACGYLADGEHPEELSVFFSEEVAKSLSVKAGFHKAKVVMGAWKGMKIATLQRKYHKEKATKSV